MKLKEVEVHFWDSVFKVREDGQISTPRCVDNVGRMKPEKVCRQFKRGKYIQVSCKKQDKWQTIRVHRLVAKAFLPDWDEDLTVDHIDGDRLNNHYSNLRMLSQPDNVRKYWTEQGGSIKRFQKVLKNGLMEKRTRGPSKYRGVCYSKSKKKFYVQFRNSSSVRIFGGYFNSAEEAAKKYNSMVFLDSGKTYELNDV